MRLRFTVGQQNDAAKRRGDTIKRAMRSAPEAAQLEHVRVPRAALLVLDDGELRALTLPTMPDVDDTRASATVRQRTSTSGSEDVELTIEGGSRRGPVIARARSAR